MCLGDKAKIIFVQVGWLVGWSIGRLFGWELLLGTETDVGLTCSFARDTVASGRYNARKRVKEGVKGQGGCMEGG